MAKKEFEVATDKTITVAKGQVTKAYNRAKELEITNDEQLADASDFLAVIKKHAKEVDAKKRTILNPLNAAAKATRDLFRDVETQAANAEKYVKQKMVDYETAKQAKIDAERKKLEEKMASTDMTPAEKVAEIDKADIPEASSTVRTAKAVTTFRVVLVARIIEPDKVPREFWVIDEARAKKAAIEAYRNGGSVEGIAVVEEKQASVRL